MSDPTTPRPPALASHPAPATPKGDVDRQRAAHVALTAGFTVLGLKGLAWWRTGSVAIFSDALESVVNVVAALLLVATLRYAMRPADRNHPYGHGKAEYFAAGFEGALIAFAAGLIALESFAAWSRSTPLPQLDLGLLLLGLATAINAAVGVYLLRSGRRAASLALEADGRHLLSDVVTSVAVVVGLLAVWWTGIVWLDAAIALGVAIHILWVGLRLVRRAVGGLMDEADPALLERIAAGLEARRPAWWIDVHSLRVSRTGPSLYADLHLVVPRFFDAERLHRVGEGLEKDLLEIADQPGEVIVHFDPCAPRECGGCAMEPCAVRSAPRGRRHPLRLEDITRFGPAEEARGGDASE